MDSIGACAFAAARALVGVRFRAQGHDPASGLDCVGLVRCAYAAAGWKTVVPSNYPLRGWSAARVAAVLGAAGFEVAVGPIAAGDVALITLPARQMHLGILGRLSFVHAHAGLRRVVEVPVDAGLLASVRWRIAPG